MSKMTTETNVHTHAEGSVSADMKGKSSPSKSRKCDYIHPCIPYFAKIQAKFGVTPETVDAPKSLIMLARLAGVEVTAEDLDRSFGALQEKAPVVAPAVEAIAVPALAVADASLVIPVVSEQKWIDFVGACYKAGHTNPAVRSILKDTHKLSKAQIDLYAPL